MTTTRAEPTWITQAREVFATMHDQSSVNEYGERLFEGNVVELVKEHTGSMTNYSHIIKLLKAHGVIRYVRRGNRYHSSLIEITGELEPNQLLPPEHLTEARSGATLAAEIEGRLVPAVKSLQAWRESLEKGGLDVAKVLQDFERRLVRLEGLVSAERE